MRALYHPALSMTAWLCTQVKMQAALQTLLEPDENPLTGANAFKKQVFQAKLGLS